MDFSERAEWEKNKPADKWRSDCPFCKENDLCIWEWKYLRIIHNKFPILWRDDHLMLIPKRHVVLTTDLNDNELLEMRDAEKYIENFFNGEKYFSFVRQSLENRSLEHLHYHYCPGNIWYHTVEEMLRKQWY